MLSGTDLGKAIGEAIKAKKVAGITQVEIAKHFDVTPQALQDWKNRGTISKDKLPELWDFFSDVVGPEHWGLKEYPHQHVNEPGTEWPFRGIELKRITRLAYDQKVEIQGAIRLLLTTFEQANKTNVRKIRRELEVAK